MEATYSVIGLFLRYLNTSNLPDYSMHLYDGLDTFCVTGLLAL